MKTFLRLGSICLCGALLVSASTALAGKPAPKPSPTPSPSPSVVPSPTASPSATSQGKKTSPTPTPAPTASPAPTPKDGRTDWNGTTSSDFNNGANWTPTGGTPGSAPPVAGDVAWFTSTPTNKTVNLSSSVSIAGLYFSGTGASGYSLTTSSTSNNFTLTATGTTIGAETGDATAVAIGAENTSGTNTIAVGISLAPSSGTTSTIYQAAGGTLAFTQGRADAFSTTSGIDLKNITLVFTGGGDFVIGTATPTGFGTIYNSVADNGTAIIMAGTGTLSLNDLNTYTGDTVIKSGTVLVGASDALGNPLFSQVYLGDTTGSSDAGLFTTTVITIPNTITIQSGNTGTIRLGSESDLSSNFVSNFTGNIFLGSPSGAAKSATFAAAIGDYVEFTGVIDENAGAIGTANVIIAGPGSIAFTNMNNLYGGTTTIGSGATLEVRSLGTGGGSSIGNSDRSDPANLVIDGGTLIYGGLQAAPETTSRSFTIGSGGATLLAAGDTGADTIAFTGTVAYQGSGNRTFTLGGTQLGGVNTFAGAIGDPSSGMTSLEKTGAASWALTGTNTYTGTTTISAGTLQLGDGGSGGSLSTSSAIVNNGNFTINQNDGVVQGIDFSGSGITGTGSFTQAGSATTTFNAVNSYSGGTFVTGSTLFLTGAGTLGATTGALQTDFGGSVDLSNTSQTVGALNGSGGMITSTSLSPSSLTIGNGGADGTYTGTISNGPGALSLTKTGAGTETLYGNSSYTGTTTVNGGTLLINGDNSAATGAVSVNNSGTVLGGFGTIGGATTVNTLTSITGATSGTIGTLTLSSTLTFTGSSIFQVDINSTSADKLVIGGILDLSGLGDTINFNQLATPTAASYTLATYSGVLGTFNITGNLPAGYTLVYLPTELDLVMTAIPEPGTWIGGALALGAIGFTQRRRLRRLATRRA